LFRRHIMITVEKLHHPRVRSIGRLIRSAWPVAAGALGVAMFATVFFGEALADRTNAPDAAKYSLKVPGGLAFAEFKGYEDWAVISIDHTDDLLKVILGNPVAIDAFRAGVPGNDKPFPDGSKMAKVEWRPKKSPDAPYDITVPGAVYDLDFMVKDSKRFADSGGWGYAVFKHDAASGMYTPATLSHKPPQGNDAKCGAACHTIVRGKDYVFTEYAKR
jgi:Cytochrome P460